MTTEHELDRCNRELAQVREALRSPKLGLFASKRLYARMGALLREIDKLTIDLAVNHVLKDTPEHETELSNHPTNY